MKTKKKEVLEKETQKIIMTYLHYKGCLAFKHRNVGIFKQNTGKYIPLPFGEKGISDIIGCTKQGQFFAIEVKRVGQKPTLEQSEFLIKVNENHGIGLLAYGIDDVANYIY